MSKFWITGGCLVGCVAALKTFLTIQLVLPASEANFALVSGLFALFYALTAAVMYVGYVQLRKHLESRQNDSVPFATDEPAAKETVILRHAAKWGLSQAEADVAIFVVKGFSNSEVAEMRGCAITTVKSQLGRIYQKTGLGSRYQLIAFVTDEVCSMAQDAEPIKARRNTRDALSVVGRNSSAA
ncbi:helix-turn-helix transcriptional regulator [Sulfitobacter sp.]|uniref:helix-turn-helix transcriptional regulator n=1 Tax=Sulfitobacter sp. TaxID=1903071 RepID=UPI003299FF79